MRCELYANLGELATDLVIRAGEFLDLGNRSHISEGNVDRAARLLADDQRGYFECKIMPRVRLKEWSAPFLRLPPGQRNC